MIVETPFLSQAAPAPATIVRTIRVKNPEKAARDFSCELVIMHGIQNKTIPHRCGTVFYVVAGQDCYEFTR